MFTKSKTQTAKNRRIIIAAIAWFIGTPLSTTLLIFISSEYVLIFLFSIFIIGIISVILPIKLIGILSRSVAVFVIVGSFIGVVIVSNIIGIGEQRKRLELREFTSTEYLEDFLNPKDFQIKQQRRVEKARQKISEIVKPTIIERITGNAETVEQNIYVMGGATLSTQISKAGAYDPSTKIWTQNASIPTARAAAGSAVLDNDIYVVGGRAASDVLS